MWRLVALVVGPYVETKLAQPSASWLCLRRLLSAPEHASGRPELRPANQPICQSADQPISQSAGLAALGWPRWAGRPYGPRSRHIARCR